MLRITKKSLGVIVLSLSILILSGVLYLTSLDSNSKRSVNSVENEENTVHSVLNNYAIAAKNHNVDRLILLSLDLSWPNPVQHKKNLKNINERIYKFETIHLEKIEKDLYQATVLVETESLQETKMKFPVLNFKGQWKVIVGQDLDTDQQETNSKSSSLKSAKFYADYFSKSAPFTSFAD